MSTTQQLQKKIMRKIYLAFGLRIAFHPLVVLASIGIVTLYTLARLVFVARVWESLAATPLGQLPQHTLSIITHADLPTLLVLSIFVGVSVGLLRQLVQLGFASQQWGRVAT